jgi:hypothetical protein
MQQFLDLFSISNTAIFILFAKAFAVLFSVLYLVYALVMVRQTQIMNKTFQTAFSGVIFFISLLQVVFALILIFVSIVFI